MFAGLVGGFGGFAVIASRWIHNEPEVERETADNPTPVIRSTRQELRSRWTEPEIVWRTDRREALVGQRAP